MVLFPFSSRLRKLSVPFYRRVFICRDCMALARTVLPKPFVSFEPCRGDGTVTKPLLASVFVFRPERLWCRVQWAFSFSVLLLLIGPTSNCALKVIETAVKKLLWCNSWRYMWDVVETLLGWSVLLSSFSLLGFERVNGFWLSSGSTSLRLSTKPLNHAPNPKKISSNWPILTVD